MCACRPQSLAGDRLGDPPEQSEQKGGVQRQEGPEGERGSRGEHREETVGHGRERERSTRRTGKGVITRLRRRGIHQGDQGAGGDLGEAEVRPQRGWGTIGDRHANLVTVAFRAKTTKDRQTGGRGVAPDKPDKRGRAEAEGGTSGSGGDGPACKNRKRDRALARSGKRKRETPSSEEKQSKTQRRGGV